MADSFNVHGVDLKIPGSGSFKIPVRAKLNEPCECNKCGETVFWARTSNFKIMPIEWRGGQYVCHYNYCDN